MTRTLGTTGVSVPRAFLGCGIFGGIGGARHLIGRGLGRRAAFAALDEASGLGIDVVDPAERYADGEGGGINFRAGCCRSARCARIRMGAEQLQPAGAQRRSRSPCRVSRTQSRLYAILATRRWRIGWKIRARETFSGRDAHGAAAGKS